VGYCPSGRLFEATACGAPVLSDYWEGLDRFFEPGSEILLARTGDDVVAALNRSPEELARIARSARERTLAEHTAGIRAGELEGILEAGVTAGV
jgi:spore maturation protein CgeB